jgi:organic anion transporter 5A
LNPDIIEETAECRSDTNTNGSEANGSDTALLGAGNQTISSIDNDDAASVDTQISMHFGNNISDMPRSIWNLVSNQVFLLVTLSASCEFTIITAFMTFIPKYLEAQFSIAASTAAILCGSVLVPSAGVGIVIGSYLVKHWELKRTGCIKFACCSILVAIILFIPTFFITCAPLDIAGVNVPYPKGLESLKPAGLALDAQGQAPQGQAPYKSRQDRSFDFYHLKNNNSPDINSTCNNDCSCDRPASFDPVCWEQEDITFFNPCLAGCTRSSVVNSTEKIHLTDKYEFSDCSCLPDTDIIGFFWGNFLKKKIEIFEKFRKKLKK